MNSTFEALVAKLNSVEWDFANAYTREDTHGIHPYPAKFIPQIPRELIRLFHPGDGSPVLDPFCGSGTTLVEAVAAGLPVVGIDLNPLAVLITKVKTTPLRRAITPVAWAVTAQAHKEPASVPKLPQINHWFLPPVQQALARLIQQIMQVDDPGIRDALKVALSSIIVRVSNQESNTRYAAIEKDVSAKQVYDLFLEAAMVVDRALTEFFDGLYAREPRCTILNRNILEVEPHELPHDVSLVVTSPPYPNAYEYWLYHKYRMYWLGMDPLVVRAGEIGTRPHYFKKNHQTEFDFERQMGRCFWLLAQVMRRGGIACFLVGRSIIHGRRINNEALLQRAAAAHGFRNAAMVTRKIPSTRKAFNPAHSTINRESIMVLVLEGA